MLSTLRITSILLLMSPSLSRASSCPPPPYYPNTSIPINNTLPTPEPRPDPGPICQIIYPASIHELNSLHPANASDPTRFFQVIHQVNQTSGFRLQVAAQVQFLNVPATSPTLCRLELVLPDSKMSRVTGPTPQFNVFKVERKPGAEATWNTYEAGNGVGNLSIIGTVDGSKDSLENMRTENSGVVKVSEGPCNETLTFQMGMAEPKSAPWINYWDWVEVSPPAAPAQGFRLVFGC